MLFPIVSFAVIIIPSLPLSFASIIASSPVAEPPALAPPLNASDSSLIGAFRSSDFRVERRYVLAQEGAILTKEEVLFSLRDIISSLHAGGGATFSPLHADYGYVKIYVGTTTPRITEELDLPNTDADFAEVLICLHQHIERNTSPMRRFKILTFVIFQRGTRVPGTDCEISIGLVDFRALSLQT